MNRTKAPPLFQQAQHSVPGNILSEEPYSFQDFLGQRTLQAFAPYQSKPFSWERSAIMYLEFSERQGQSRKHFIMCSTSALTFTSKNTTQSYDLPLTKAICLGLTQCWVMMKPQLFIHDMISMACCTSIRWSFKSIHCSFFPTASDTHPSLLCQILNLL